MDINEKINILTQMPPTVAQFRVKVWSSDHAPIIKVFQTEPEAQKYKECFRALVKAASIVTPEQVAVHTDDDYTFGFTTYASNNRPTDYLIEIVF